LGAQTVASKRKDRREGGKEGESRRQNKELKRNIKEKAIQALVFAGFFSLSLFSFFSF